MKRLVVAMCGAAALGIASLATQANAAPLTPSNPLKGSEIGTQAEQVAWRRVCAPVRRGPVVVQRCNNVWVGRPRGPGYYGYGPRPAPRYGYYNSAPRGYYAPGPRYY